MSRMFRVRSRSITPADSCSRGLPGTFAQRSRFPKTVRGKAAVNPPPVKYWEIIAANLSKAGWSWGCVSEVDTQGRTIWIADAHRDDGKRFVVRAGEKLTAFWNW